MFLFPLHSEGGCVEKRRRRRGRGRDEWEARLCIKPRSCGNRGMESEREEMREEGVEHRGGRREERGREEPCCQ